MARSNFSRRSRTLRSAIGITTVLTLGVTLAACSAEGAGEGESGAQTITLWQYYGDPDTPTGGPLYEFVDRFQESQDEVDVEVRFIPYGDFNRTLLQSAAAGDLPDIALINAFDTAAMADAGVIEDISERVEEWGEQDAYFPTSWETTQVDGATYGIPHLADAYAVYYNKTLLDAAGLTPPTTWQEMEETAAALAVDGKSGLAVSGIEGPEGATGLVIRTLAEGGDLTEFDSQAGETALNSFKAMADSGAMSPGVLTWNEDDVKNQFATGQAAMMINSATYVSVLREENPELEWDVALLPKGSEAQLTFLSAENLTIGEGSEHSDAAWDLITFMQQPEELATYLPERNKLPARDDVPDESDDPVRATFAEQLQNAWAPEGKLAAVSNDVFTHVQRALQATLSGSASTADALKSAQTGIDEALAK